MSYENLKAYDVYATILTVIPILFVIMGFMFIFDSLSIAFPLFIMFFIGIYCETYVERAYNVFYPKRRLKWNT